MALLDHEGDIPEEYLTGFEREMQETTDGKVTKSWKEYAKGYVPRGTEEVKFDEVKNKTAWFKDKDGLGKQTLSGTWQTESGKLGRQRAQVDKASQLMRACKMGDTRACELIQASTPGFSSDKFKSSQKRNAMSPYQRKGFAQGGMLDQTAKLWKMESTYPEFQKGIASRVTKDRVPTAPIEEEYMYSPTQGGYPQEYAEGGSVYDTEGSMLAPEVPLDFEEEMPMAEAPMMEEESELGLSPEETEVLGQAMSDYPELEVILNKVSSSVGTDEFTADGTVEGPGTETSDSIPARLSDGEFVFTAKAVKQLGVDKLRKMMDRAETDYDEAGNKQAFAQMSDAGFAKGGFFSRPSYNGGGLTGEPQAPEHLQSSKKDMPRDARGLGTRILDGLADFTGGNSEYAEAHEAHKDEMDARERNAWIDAHEDELAREAKTPEQNKEEIYPREDYPELYRDQDEYNSMLDGRKAIVR